MASTSSDHGSFISYSSDDSDYDTTEDIEEEDDVVAVFSYLDDLLQDTSREVGTSSDAIESNTSISISRTAAVSGHKYPHHGTSGEADDENEDEVDDMEEEDGDEEFEDLISLRHGNSSDTTRAARNRNNRSNQSRHDEKTVTMKGNSGPTLQDLNGSMYSSVLLSSGSIAEPMKPLSSSQLVDNGGGGVLCCGVEEEKSYIDQNMKAIEYYLNQHHQIRRIQKAKLSSTVVCAINNENDGNVLLSDCTYEHDDDYSDKGSSSNSTNNDNSAKPVNDDYYSINSTKIFPSNSFLLEDHQLYYYTNSANPIAVKQTFLYCIQTDDVDLLKQLLRDIGIEYLLRHCVQYHGLLEENTRLPTSSATNPTSKKAPASASASASASSTPRSKTKSKSKNFLPDHDRLNKNQQGSDKSSEKSPSANIFWIAALHGSAKVLSILLQATWIHFAEISQLNHHHQIIPNLQGKDENRNDNTSCNSVNNVSDYGTSMIGEDSEYTKKVNSEIIEESTRNKITKYLNDAASSYGTSPMYVAAAQNHKDVILLLLKYGVDPNKATSDSYGRTTPSIIAASRNHTDALQGLAEANDIDFNKANQDNVSPLLAACQNGCLDAVRFLTNFTILDDHGFDIPVVNTQCQDSMGLGCASVAAQHDQHEVIIYLCQMHDPRNTGIDVNQRSPEGDTVIHVATRYNRQTVVKALLEMIPRTCNITQINKFGMNALHIAASHGYTVIVKEFIQCLPAEIIQELDIEDLYGMTPIFYATLKGHYEIVSALASVSNINTLLRVQLTKKRNKRKGDANDKTRKRKVFTYQTPLHAAAMYGFVNIVYTLLHSGAEINKFDSGGHTALSLAAKMGNLEVVKILVEHGADVKMKSKRGKTPLAKAKRYKRQEIVEFLEPFYVK